MEKYNLDAYDYSGYMIRAINKVKQEICDIPLGSFKVSAKSDLREATIDMLGKLRGNIWGKPADEVFDEICKAVNGINYSARKTVMDKLSLHSPAYVMYTIKITGKISALLDIASERFTKKTIMLATATDIPMSNFKRK
ncbi:MAG: hypothetical protein LBL34_02805 [Clostridiales bacterium]|jgi:hypothetical protein|nr:hypothetical protein [Clostridiales bacterium]